MAKKSRTQKTKRGQEIPVPKRKDVMRDLLKVSKPKPESESKDARGPKKK